MPNFIPAEFDPSTFENIEPLGEALLRRPINSPSELEQWLLDASEFACAISEHRARIRINYSCHTDDERIEKLFMDFVENIQPRLDPLFFELQRKYVDCPWRETIETTPRLQQLGRSWQADVEVFREENVPLATQITRVVSQYDKLCAAMEVTFDGRTRTLQQMTRYQEATDRGVREQTWRLVADRRLVDREAVDELFDQTIALRQRIAGNAGFDDFRAYSWKARHRFDYGVDECHAFADAVEQVVVPVVDELDRQRRQTLDLDALRPWDLAVDPKGRAPLEPFDPNDVDGFVARTRQIFDRIDPRLGEQFGRLKMERNLDLESRKGKRPGGYQAALEMSCEPFIFMNAAGVQRDVETMLHEGGHAFHFMASCSEPLVFVRHAPLEFCEVASMSMELLGAPHLDVFYDEAAHQRAVRKHLEGRLRILPWIATIDQFQHWLYTHPEHSRDERTAAWLDVHDRFGGDAVDWSGLDAEREAMWQRQIHLFHHPFYYIEYGIAQLGALGVWRNYQQDAAQALTQLLDAFALAGTRPLPELFETAGIPFRFDAETVRTLIAGLREELEAVGV